MQIFRINKYRAKYYAAKGNLFAFLGFATSVIIYGGPIGIAIYLIFGEGKILLGLAFPLIFWIILSFYFAALPLIWIIGIFQYGFFVSTIFCLIIFFIFSLPDIFFALSDIQSKKLAASEIEGYELENKTNLITNNDEELFFENDDFNQLEASDHNRIECPFCEEEISEGEFKCPYCAEIIHNDDDNLVKTGNALSYTESSELLPNEETDTNQDQIIDIDVIYCPYCEEEIPLHSSKCPYCAEILLEKPGQKDKADGDQGDIEIANSSFEGIREMNTKEKTNEEALKLLKQLQLFMHRQWFGECLQKDFNPTFVLSVILHDNDGEYIDGRFLANGSRKTIEYHIDGLKEAAKDEKGNFIKW